MPRPRKVVLLGDFGVGKTSFGTRLAKGEFHESTLATLGVAHFNVAVRAAGDGPLAPATKLEIWDTAGQERYRSMDTLKLYLRGAAGAIVVADLTRAASFDAAVRVIEQIRGEEIGCKIPIALAANKSDLPSRQVEAAAVQAAAADLKLADARRGARPATASWPSRGRWSGLRSRGAAGDRRARGTFVLHCVLLVKNYVLTCPACPSPSSSTRPTISGSPPPTTRSAGPARAPSRCPRRRRPGSSVARP